MTQSFSGIVPALKEEIISLKGEKTELEKKLKSRDDEIHRLRTLIDNKEPAHAPLDESVRNITGH